MLKKFLKWIFKNIMSILCAIIIVEVSILPMSHENGFQDITLLTFVTSVMFGVINFQQNLLTRGQSKKTYERDLINSKRTTQIQDALSKIEQLYENLYDLDKRLKAISIEQELHTTSSSNTNDLPYKLKDLMYDLDFLYNNHINMLIPACFERDYTQLEDLKSEIKSGLKQIYDALKSYYDYLTGTQNEGQDIPCSFPLTIPSAIFDKISNTSSEFKEKLHTVNS